MKLDLPSFNKHNTPAFLQRVAPVPKPEPKATFDASQRLFTADERDILAKAWARGMLHNMEIAKAARKDSLAKALADRDTFKAAFETVSGRLDTIAPQIADMAKRLKGVEDIEKRLKQVEDQPLPPKTAGTHAVWVQ